ncbi:MAG: DEAD/DEAH box helicase [Lentisphaeria bacterium]|nr:DEAD/DEAH box helicase [Candidatus Neomarinimicrobiota bacterium]MCF7842188.1 DEAD/DEAH box helicase [Lentisphaeria bacterium]
MTEKIHASGAQAQTFTQKRQQESSNKTLQGVFTQLIPELQRAIVSAGYDQPTPIQEQSIPHLVNGRDLVGTAQTGTGKTAAFALPLLQHLASFTQRPKKGTPRALILAPTRELAIQIDESIRTYGRYLQVNHTTIFGGVNQYRQVKAMNQGVDIVVATPGRLLDLMNQGVVKLHELKVFILDEVDRMLDMGFIPDIRRIMSKIPAERQTLFFSATMAPKMQELAYTMVNNPVRVTITPDQPAVERISQKILFVEKRQKDSLLVSLLENKDISKVLVFTQMKHVANRVVQKLHTAGIRSTAIHGNKSQSARTDALNGFKRGQFRVLVATDVAARGLDVDNISHVINYDMPTEAETYVHRIGRTARAGAEGDAISFCSFEDRSTLRDIERLLGKSVPTDSNHAWHSEAAAQPSAPEVRSFGVGGRGRGRRSRGGSARAHFPAFRGR